VTGVQCDVAKAACVVWPRCRNTPYFGCLAAAQLCESVRYEADPPPLSGTNLSAATGLEWLPTAPSFLLPLIFLLLLAVVYTAFFAAVIVRRDCCAPVSAKQAERVSEERYRVASIVY
jgi:hypothetical protein